MINVLKASAGAGKTYSLVLEYIKALMKAEEGFLMTGRGWVANPHRHILAITFTNNSTNEMKERILKDLDKLGKGKHEGYEEAIYSTFALTGRNVVRNSDPGRCPGLWTGCPFRAQENEENGCAGRTQREAENGCAGRTQREAVNGCAGRTQWEAENGCDTEDVLRCRIREAARRLLEDILNDYSMMRVSTIDSFFSQIIRSFSRDLGLDQTPVAEIDDARIREKAVDTMLAELDGEKNKELLRFVKDFSHSQITEGKKWKIRDSLIEFSKIILSEDYIKNFDSDKTTLEEVAAYKKRLKERVKEHQAEAERALAEMEMIARANEGMDKNMFNAIINRNMGSTLWEKKADEVKFFNKGKGTEEAKSRLRDLFGDVKKAVFSSEYYTLVLILKSIHITGVLGELRRVTEQICRDNDCILLSTANHLITKIIDGCDTPFIYERVGVSTNNYMIDEFQDTSHIQWDNFVPLIKEANAQGNDSLIVGDIKQSIYRWRNGDWNILHSEIKNEFGESVDETNLPYNFRSSPAVINFNNAIYKKLPELMDKALGKTIFGEIYSNAKQEIGEKNSGLKGSVETHFVGKDVSKDEFMEQALGMIVNDIIRYAREERERLDEEEKNAKDEEEREEIREKKKNILSKTAVIVRKNDEAAKVAEALAAAGIPFCSSESFLLASDTMVKMIIAYMRLIVAPGEELYRREMEFALEQVGGALGGSLGTGSGMAGEALGGSLGTGSIDPSLCSRVNVPVPTDPCSRVNVPVPIDPLPMEEIPMALVDAVGAEATPFVYSLVDTIKRYVMNNDASLVKFLEWWDEHKEKLCIPMPSINGVVTIMTIHKSKGLEFKNVYLLMAREQWNCGIKSRFKNYRSVETNDLPHIILDINSSKLKETEYADVHDKENLDCCVDTLNTLYVATTRAVEKLYIVAHTGGKELNMNDLLMSAVEGKEESIDLSTFALTGRTDIDTLSPRAMPWAMDRLPFQGAVVDNELEEEYAGRQEKKHRVRDRALAFARITRESEEQRHGTVCHQFLSLIEKEGDEVAAMEKMIADGVIREEEKGELMRVYSVLAEKGVFNPAYRSMNEQSIAIDGRIYRPDRIIFTGEKSAVVIDYKFGEERPEHKKQIEGYAVLLRKKGYEVETVIYYL